MFCHTIAGMLHRHILSTGTAALPANVVEEIGGPRGNLPIPNSFPQASEDQTHNYDFFDNGPRGSEAPSGRWTHGPSLDGKGTFSVFKNVPLGGVPDLGPARPDSAAETLQIA